MASFCKQCSIEIFDEDLGDLAGLEYGALVMCEGCGFIQIDTEGRCVSLDCLENHGAHDGKL